jgi:hypothetical protein
VDWPEDPGCASAGDTSEAGGGCSDPLVLASGSAAVDFTNASNEQTLSCSPSPAGELVFNVQPPEWGYLEVWGAPGISAIGLREVCWDPNSELVCSASNGEGGVSLESYIGADEARSIVVEGSGRSSTDHHPGGGWSIATQASPG